MISVEKRESFAIPRIRNSLLILPDESAASAQVIVAHRSFVPIAASVGLERFGLAGAWETISSVLVFLSSQASFPFPRRISIIGNRQLNSIFAIGRPN